MTDDAPTSEATTQQTEPEVIAGIASAEGQPETYDFDATPPADRRGWTLLGGVALLGFVVGLDMTGRRRR
ncbi:MAG: hypothetical protein WB697_02905 [Stellaceae bacterium]